MQLDFNFLEFKKIVCTAYQTTDFKQAFKFAKKEYLETFDEYLPYPIQNFKEEYVLLCKMLQKKIDDNGFLEISLVSKTTAKQLYNITEKFFELFYPEPEKEVDLENSRSLYGKIQKAKLYNQNKILAILESKEYEDYLLQKNKRKKQFLNY